MAAIIPVLGLLASCSFLTDAENGREATPESTPVVVAQTSTSTHAPTPVLTFTATLRPTQTSTRAGNVFTPTASAPSGIGRTQVSTKDDMVMVAVPGGEFLMGSADSDLEAFTEEKPQHRVQLDDFWIERTEVTNAMYALCVEAGACRPPSSPRSFLRVSYYDNPQFANYPVIYVSWQEAETYCQWTNKRLPTEAEWEKAARGVDGRLYPWGNTGPEAKLLNYDLQIRDTIEVGKYLEGVSPYGAFDMAGNVWEWVADWYAGNYYATSPTNNPLGPPTGTKRVLRGASWVDGPRGVRAAFRSWFAPDLRDGNVGFRCAR